MNRPRIFAPLELLYESLRLLYYAVSYHKCLHPETSMKAECVRGGTGGNSWSKNCWHIISNNLLCKLNWLNVGALFTHCSTTCCHDMYVKGASFKLFCRDIVWEGSHELPLCGDLQCGDTWELQDSHANMTIMPQCHAWGSKDRKEHSFGQCLTHIIVLCECCIYINNK